MSLNRFFRGASAMAAAGWANQSLTVLVNMSTVLLNGSAVQTLSTSDDMMTESNSTSFDNKTVCSASVGAADCSSSSFVFPSIAIIVVGFLLMGVVSRCGKSNFLWRRGEGLYLSLDTEQSTLKEVLVQAPTDEVVVLGSKPK